MSKRSAVEADDVVADGRERAADLAVAAFVEGHLPHTAVGVEQLEPEFG